MEFKKSSTVFTGFGLKGTVPVQKIKEFINNQNNIKLINELDSKNIDLYMGSEGNKIHFVSKKYGDLENYGLLPHLIEEFYIASTNISKLMKKIDTACSKAQKEVNKYSTQKEDVIRGC